MQSGDSAPMARLASAVIAVTLIVAATMLLTAGLG